MKVVLPRLGVFISLVFLAACANVLPEVSPDQVRPGEDDQDVAQSAPDAPSASDATAASGDSADKDEDEDGLPSIASMVEDAELFEGFFDLYRSADDGTVHLRIPTNRLEEELIYTATVTDGVVETGLFRGQYRDNKIVKLQRHFNRIEIVQPNTRFYFDPKSALSRAADANAPDAVLAVMEIVAEDPASDDQPGAVLVKFSPVLLSEDLVQIKPAKRPGTSPGEALTLGKFSAERSKISSIASYPDNALVYTDYVYELAAPLAFGGDDVTDARAITASVQHSFIKVPDNGYNPRFDDYRVGFFTNRVTDLTSRDPAPYRDVINRWNLVKKNPDQAISEPVEPITWWLENTTPKEFREMITKAALSWNSAFEAAGFRNAIVVKQQPDDADWDAGDIRYNVLRWTSSATPPFGGYGPSFTNPRTGQIIGADIMLEFAFLTNRLRIQDLLQPDDVMPTGTPEHHCALAAQMQADVIFAQHALVSAGADAALSERLIEDSLYMLILHEIAIPLD